MFLHAGPFQISERRGEFNGKPGRGYLISTRIKDPVKPIAIQMKSILK
jgi:hypothetical protein